MLKLLQLTGLVVAVGFSGALNAAQPVTNGDFETGSLSAWQDTSTNGATVRIVQKNTCFSAGDTSQLNIRGNFSALMRSNAQGDENSQSILTSAAFTAGDGFAFIALSESLAGFEKPTVNLTVQIIDASTDSVVVSQAINTARAPLNRGCPSTGINTRFRSHYISTRAYSGNGIKIRFVQSTRLQGAAFFTLIDQVALFNEGEQPIFYSRPHPQAGMGKTNWGMPFLDSTGSFDGDKNAQDLSYSWFIDSERVRDFKKPCVGDLSDGNHTAVLYVNDGQHALSDVIQFVIDVPEPLRDSVTAVSADADNFFASTGPIAQDPECQLGLPEYEIGINPPDVDVNDPFDVEGNDNISTNDDGNGETSSTTINSNTNSLIPTFSTGTDTNTTNGVNGTVDTTSVNVTLRTAPSQEALFNEAYELGSSGIRWNPVSEGSNKLEVSTPSSFPEATAMLLKSNGTIIEFGESTGKSEAGRATYRFNRAGSLYQNNIILRIGNTDYKVVNPAADLR